MSNACVVRCCVVTLSYVTCSDALTVSYTGTGRATATCHVQMVHSQVMSRLHFLLACLACAECAVFATTRIHVVTA